MKQAFLFSERIEDIVNNRQTDVLLLNEIALKGKREVRMKEFFLQKTS